jgi:hypothetical protein
LTQGDFYDVVPFNNTRWTAALAPDISSQFDQRQRTAYSAVYTSRTKKSAGRRTSATPRPDWRRSRESGLSQSPAASADGVAEVAERTATLSNMQRAVLVYQRFAEHGQGMKVSQADVDAFLRKRNIVAMQCRRRSGAWARAEDLALRPPHHQVRHYARVCQRARIT